MIKCGVGGITPTPLMLSNHSFLGSDVYREPTNEMIDWYYRTQSVRDIYISVVDEHTSVVDVIEVIGDNIISRSFTIGKIAKKSIYDNYMFYHPMESGD